MPSRGRGWVAVVSAVVWCVACGGDDGPSDAGGSPEDAGRLDAGPGGDDGGMGDDTGPLCECTDHSACDDGDYCNGAEECSECACMAGTPPDCDDADDCTADACSSEMAACTHTPRDADGDGFGDATCGGEDCDDADALRNPGAVEACDPGDRDEDCDTSTFGEIDADGDGAFDAACCNGTTCGLDCDDTRGGVNPSAPEVCNRFDDDCDGRVDEGVLVAGYVDADGDGHGDGTMPVMTCAMTSLTSLLGDDCDDGDPTRHPGQLEVCDGRDNDCDALADEDAAEIEWFLDGDGDGFGRADAASVTSCAPIPGHSAVSGDCDDADASISPGDREACNGEDDDCNGIADFDIGGGDFEDDDGDGFTDARCAGVTLPDCDDRRADVHSGAPEICDGRDNDCDGVADEASDSTTWYVDADRDGFGDASAPSMTSCVPPAGHVGRAGDCDDTRAEHRPGVTDDCNLVDEDCDGEIDENAARSPWYADVDGDGYGTGEPVLACVRPAARAERSGDCADMDATRRPGAMETCNGLDDDCDSLADDGVTRTFYRDADGDGHGDLTAPPITACTAPPGSSDRADDCDDADATRNPTEVEVCNGRDDDCDAVADDGAAAACLLDHATAECRMGACGVLACDSPWGDCDGAAANGCEVDTRSSTAHCSRCGLPCPFGPFSTPQCAGGICSIDCNPGRANCDLNPSTGCEVDTATDPLHCGGCGRACPLPPRAVRTCTSATCGFTCQAGYGDCDAVAGNGCERALDRDPMNCGTCGRICAFNEACIAGSCVAPFPSDETDGDLMVMGPMVFPPGRHDFRSLYVGPMGSITTTGIGVLDIRATREIVVDGVIDVSGGRGGGGGGACLRGFSGGGGGATGNPLAPGANSTEGGCALGGTGGRGTSGGDGPGCGENGGNRGGGGGGDHNGASFSAFGGGGGGGFAGGGGAGSGSGAGASFGTSLGGAADGGGGEAGLGVPYAGGDGVQPTGMYCEAMRGGGGGSIGSEAAGDLAVATTFSPGSGGGGGGGGSWYCGAVYGHAGTAGGGGGGGGALRLASITSVIVNGELRATGGAGGPGRGGAGGGGGGSGGVIYISAPTVEVYGRVNAAGGAAGIPDGGPPCRGDGGAGGLGRIRVSAVQSTCIVEGTWTPTLESLCTPSPPSGTPGRVFVGAYPN